MQEAGTTAQAIGIDWDKVNFSLEDFLKGMNVELEHGLVDSQTNITNDDPIMTGKITLIHLKELDDYYQRLEVMEEN